VATADIVVVLSQGLSKGWIDRICISFESNQATKKIAQCHGSRLVQGLSQIHGPTITHALQVFNRYYRLVDEQATLFYLFAQS